MPLCNQMPSVVNFAIHFLLIKPMSDSIRCLCKRHLTTLITVRWQSNNRKLPESASSTSDHKSCADFSSSDSLLLMVNAVSKNREENLLD